MKILNSTNVDGQLTILTGSATTPSLSVVNDTNTGIFFPAADTIALTEGGVEVLRINSSANVGIGTQTPSQKLEVIGTVSATSFVSRVASGTAPIVVSSNTVVTNLNADLLDGQHGSYYQNAGNLNAGTLLGARLSTTSPYAILSTTPKNGVLRVNLGNPTLNELTLEPGEATNKTWFHDINKAVFEYTTDGTTWLTWSPSDSAKRNLFSGRYTGVRPVITNGWVAARIQLEAISYVYLDYLYHYISTNGHSLKLKIERSFDGTTWSDVVADSGSGSSWPGHFFLPHDTIPWHPNPSVGSHFKFVRITYTPTWNATYPSNNIDIHLLNWFGGYPIANREIYSWDSFRNVDFPAALRGAAGSATTPSISFSSDINTGLFNPSADTIAFVEGGIEVMRINSNSNIGIGTLTPTTKLEVVGTMSSSNLQTGEITASSITSTNIFATTLTATTGNVTTLTVTNLTVSNLTASSRIFVGTGSTTSPSIVAINDTNTGIYFPAADTIGFVEGGVEVVRIDSSGRVGIGNTDPSVALDVTGEIAIRGGEAADDARMYFRASDNSNRFTIETDLAGSTDDDLLGFRGNLTDNILVLRGNGNVGIGVINPSIKLQVAGTISSSNLQTGVITASSVTSSNIFATTLTASTSINVTGVVSATSFISTIASGTAPFTVSSTTSVVNLNADLLDGQHGTYYLDYTNITNKPTVSDANVIISSGAGLTGGGSFTLNQENEPLLPNSGLFPSSGLNPNGEISLSISHADTSNIEDIIIQNNDALSSLTFDSFGHVLSATTSSFKITGFTSTNTSSWASTTAGGFSVKKDIAIVDVTSNDYPEIAFNLSTYTIAQNALISYVETYNGGISLYAVSTPTDTVSFDYIILKG